jgi:dTDP-4-dehydrorhamnose 3,5-epimerase
MKIIKKKFNDIFLINSKKFSDKRGYFSEIYNKKNFYKIINKNINFVQLNFAFSKVPTLRGLHFQKGRYAQGKLIKVLKGKIYDVVININPKSKNFRKWAGFILSSNKNNLLWVPKGYAHGYLTLTKNTEVQYLCDNYYKKTSERCILWSDKTINIKWPKNIKFNISDKDKKGNLFTSFKNF